MVADPWRLPAWWPGVTRVEEATTEAWTTVMTSAKGRAVRADFTRVEADEPHLLVWRQELAETLKLVQRPRGWARFAPLQLRIAGRRQLQAALDGLVELLGPAEEPSK